MEIRKNTVAQWLFYIAIAAALITQFPYINKEIASIFNEIMWILAVGFIVIDNFRKLPVSNYLLGMVMIMIFSYIAEILLIVAGVIFSMMPYVSLIRIPIMIYFCSYYMGTTENDENNVGKKIMLIFGVLAFIMSIQVAMQFLTNFETWQNSEMYMYDGSTHKNSSAQTLGNCILVLFIFWHPKKWFYNAIRYIGVIIVAAGLLYIQSRAALVAVGIVIAVSAFFRGEKKKILVAILATIVAVLIVINSESIMSLLKQAFFIDKYSMGGELDLNRFSSGRLDFWDVTWSYFLDSPFVGIGNTYCDNFYINIMASGGVFIGVPYIILYLIRVYKNIGYYWQSFKCGQIDSFAQFAAGVSIFYMIISFFEGFPPYGPGVSCLLFWMISGYLDGRSSIRLDYSSRRYR